MPSPQPPTTARLLLALIREIRHHRTCCLLAIAANRPTVARDHARDAALYGRDLISRLWISRRPTVH